MNNNGDDFHDDNYNNENFNGINNHHCFYDEVDQQTLSS